MLKMVHLFFCQINILLLVVILNVSFHVVTPVVLVLTMLALKKLASAMNRLNVS